jgi:glycosyltransferase involved in cell wall biosynthesis
VEWKGIRWLIRAFAKLDESERQNTVLVIGGTGPDSEKQSYFKLIYELGLKNKVFLVGKIDYQHIGELINAAQVFVLPAFHEPFGLVLLEALACGTRIVTTNQGGPAWFVPDQLKEKRDAILVPGLRDLSPEPSTAEIFVRNLSNAITEQLSKPLDYKTRHEIASTVQHLTWNTYINRLISIYHTALI